MALLRIPRDSNLRYLPMFFFLTEAYVNSCPTLPKLPRNLKAITESPKAIEIVNSIQFFNEVADATAALAFPHFGFRGWKEDYTGYCPVWKLSYSLPLWVKIIEEVTGWGLQAMLKHPKSQDLPFLLPEYVGEVMAIVVKRAIDEQNWQPILDVIKEMPCEEDFEKRRSRVRKDWERKWYHTRAKLKTVSLEECMEDDEHKIHEVAVDYSANTAETVESEDFVKRFKSRLSQKDMAILELRVQGHIYEDIAEKLGYKNHSGVLKRMRVIMAEYKKYEEEQNLERISRADLLDGRAADPSAPLQRIKQLR